MTSDPRLGEKNGSGTRHKSVLKLKVERTLSSPLLAWQGHFREGAGRQEEACREGGRL